MDQKYSVKESSYILSPEYSSEADFKNEQTNRLIYLAQATYTHCGVATAHYVQWFDSEK